MFRAGSRNGLWMASLLPLAMLNDPVILVALSTTIYSIFYTLDPNNSDTDHDAINKPITKNKFNSMVAILSTMIALLSFSSFVSMLACLISGKNIKTYLVGPDADGRNFLIQTTPSLPIQECVLSIGFAMHSYLLRPERWTLWCLIFFWLFLVKNLSLMCISLKVHYDLVIRTHSSAIVIDWNSLLFVYFWVLSPNYHSDLDWQIFWKCILYISI